MKLSLHPLAEIFPPLSDAEYKLLKADIAVNGLLEPIWLTQQRKIVDGRHRYRACQDLKLKMVEGEHFIISDYNDADEALTSVVLSLNLHRRHLNESQRSMVAARVKPVYAEQARARMGHGKSKNGKGKSKKKKAVKGEKSKVKAAPPPKTEAMGEAREHAAARLNVSARSVSNAEKVMALGVPALVQAVNEGLIAVSAALKVVKKSPEEQEALTAQVLCGEVKNMSAAVRRQRIDSAVERVEALEPVAGEYHVIVADPPWRYNHRIDDETHRGRTPYPTMSEEEIRKLAVPAADDCVLWLWCTNAFLADGTASRVALAWGFQPKTLLTWAKPRMGVGDWLRGQTEHVILAIRGRPQIKDPVPSTLLQVSTGMQPHSVKPEEFYELVERHCPGRRVEMFACKQREGWDQHGSELAVVAELDEEPTEEEAEAAESENLPEVFVKVATESENLPELADDEEIVEIEVEVDEEGNEVVGTSAESPMNWRTLLP